MDAITYPFWDQGSTMLVKRTLVSCILSFAFLHIGMHMLADMKIITKLRAN